MSTAKKPAVNPAHAPLIAQRTTILEQMAEVDKQLSAIAGTLSAKTKRITDEIVNAAPDLSNVENTQLEVKTASLVSHVRTLVGQNPVRARLVIDDVLEDLREVKAEADAAITSKVRETLKATSASSDEASALKLTRSTLADQAAAFNTVLGQMGGDVVEIPSAPRVGGGGGSGGGKVRSSNVEYYRRVGGVETFYGADRSLSLIAFHLGVPVGDLETALKSAGVEDVAKPFEVEVTVEATKGKKTGKSTTVTIGANVLDKGDVK